MKNHAGLVFALSAYLFWGVVPIYWKQMEHIPSAEIVVHRMIWACAFVAIVIVVSREWSAFKAVLADKKSLLILSLASLVVSLNWAIFIWAVNSEQIVEVSLGYFINPLISVCFGMLFFGERVNGVQFTALLVAALGVLVMMLEIGGLPMISLSLAITFSIYSVLKKKVTVSATHGLAVEMLVVLLPALAFLFYLDNTGSSSFGVNQYDTFYLIFGGLFTLIPLLLFAAAAKRVSMTTLGMTQYIGPTCQLMIAVFLYKEPFNQGTFLAFSFIWLALAIYSIDQVQGRRKKHQKK